MHREGLTAVCMRSTTGRSKVRSWLWICILEEIPNLKIDRKIDKEP